MKFLTAWELLHETADEGLKAAIARGEQTTQGQMASDRGAFVDGLAAMIDAKKEVLKDELTNGTDASLTEEDSPAIQAVTELRFEVAELRGRLESMGAALDAIAAKL
jgi:hypothetical protein